MAFTGATSKISYIPEVTFGVTPATPQMIDLPMISTTLDLTKDIINDPTIVYDRMEREESHGNRHVAGDLVVAAAHGQFDDFVEAALGGTWTTNVVKAAGATGGTPRSFTVEQLLSPSPVITRVFTGCRVNTWNVTGAINANVQSTFGIIGKDMTTGTVVLDATPTDILAKSPMKFLGGTITIAGVDAKMTAFNMTYNNGMTDLFALQNSTAAEINWEQATVTGSYTIWLNDLVEYNRFLNETTAAGVFTMTDGTNTHSISMPKMKINSGAIPVSGAGVLFMTVNFKALRDAGLASTVSVTRSA